MGHEDDLTREDRVHIISGLKHDDASARAFESEYSAGDTDATVIEAPSQGLADAARFRDLGSIGVGGMGEVRQAYDEALQRNVAVKHLKVVRSQASTQRFLQEALVTGQLDHPNIVPVYDVGFRDSEQPFFVMKLVRGETLSSQLATHGDKPPLDHFLRIFLKVCEAISFAHSRGVIHRDLKPSNIMVGPHGEVYVMDWGLALVYTDPTAHEPSPSPHAIHEAPTVHTSPPSERGQILGTAGYMAPEQAQGRTHEIDARTDIFGLGGILYHLLTGQPPYANPAMEAQLAMAARGEVLPPTQVVPDRKLPPGLCRITMRALAARPEDRYQSVAELMHDVDAFLRGGGWFDTVQFPAGTLIMREGDEPDAAYIIEQGTCEVFKLRNGQRIFLRHLGPGEVFGEAAIFTGRARSACVEATEDVKLISITREALDYELAEMGWLATFVRAVAQRFSEHDARSLTSDVTGAHELLPDTSYDLPDS